MWGPEKHYAFVLQRTREIAACQVRARKDTERQVLVAVLEKWLTMAGKDLPDVFSRVNIRALAEATAALILDGP